MTAGESNELTDALFKRIEQLAQESGVAIMLTPGASTLKLEFADGQRILLNHDAQAHKIWLAAGSAGTEYNFNGQYWSSAQDNSELFTNVTRLITQTIQSNPVNAQIGKPVVRPAAHTQASTTVVTHEERSASPLKTFALLSLVAWIGYAGFQHFSRTAPPDNSASDSTALIDAGNRCDTVFPQNGSTYIFPASHIQPNNPDDTEITVKNDHRHPFLAIFTAPKSVIPYLSVLVQANQSATVKLPTGQYDLMFSTGRTWCNLRTGFSNGQQVKLNTTLSVLQHQPVQLSALSSGNDASDFQIFIKSSAQEAPPPPTQFSGDGVMEIRQHSDGHFHIAGSINNTPVTYLVDTGASVTSLSQGTADRAGVTDCKPATFQTANGAINGCIGRVAQLTIGNYEVQNAVVAVMPNMQVELLGMNVLSQFQISQSNGLMRLSRR